MSSLPHSTDLFPYNSKHSNQSFNHLSCSLFIILPYKGSLPAEFLLFIFRTADSTSSILILLSSFPFTTYPLFLTTFPSPMILPIQKFTKLLSTSFSCLFLTLYYLTILPFHSLSLFLSSSPRPIFLLPKPFPSLLKIFC